MSDPGPLVLIVEDEAPMRRFLRTSLRAHGFRLVEASTAAEALVAVASHNPDLVLLDLGLPDMDGLDVTKRVRETSKVPIVVLSARGREDDKVAALDAGADDYVQKPFGTKELLARMRVALRHARDAVAPDAPPVIDIDGLHIDFERREVTRDGQEVHLTPIEYRLLALLGQNAGKVLTHRQILSDVWGPGSAHQSHYVRVFMAELRKKVEASPARPRILLTEPGVGYRMRDPERT